MVPTVFPTDRLEIEKAKKKLEASAKGALQPSAEAIKKDEPKPDQVVCRCGAFNDAGSVYCTFCKYKLDQSNDADLNSMVESVRKDYGIRFVTVVRGFGSKESNERKAARKYLKRARKLGFTSIKNRFENDDDFASHMKE